MVFENIINKHFPGWNKIKIDGIVFDDIFQVEGYPLWWFYSRFITPHVFSGQLSLNQALECNNSGFLSNLYLNLKALAFKKYFYYNEKMKQKVTVNIPEPGDKVLFLTYTNHYDVKSGAVFRIQKLMDIIRKDKKLEPLVLYTDPVSNIFSMKIKNFTPSIYGFVISEDKKKAQELALSFAGRWNKLDKSVLFKDQWELVKPTMNLFFSFEFMYNTILYYQTCKRIILEQQVKAAILTSRNGLFDRCMIAAAHHLKTPTFIIQHGIGLAMTDTLPQTFSGVKHVVFGEVFRQRMLNLGANYEDLLVTGPLIFDEILPFMSKTSLKKGKITLITEPFIEENRIGKEDYFKHIGKILDSLQGISSEIVIKLHPREKNKAEYEKLLLQKNIQNASIVDSVGSRYLYSALQDADLVINFLSTVALEAMILDKPVLTIDPLVGTSFVKERGPYRGGVMVDINGDIRNAVLEALQDPPKFKKKRKEVVKDFCYKIDGRAAERTAQAIYELVKKQ